MSTSQTVLPSSHLTSGLLDGLNPTLNFSYTWAGVACLVVFIVYTSTRPKNLYNAIPAIGRTGLFTSYLDAIQYLKRGNEFVMEGYAKYQSGIFRVPELNRWHVIVSGPQLTDELRKAPDDVLSFEEAARENLATDWVFGPSIAKDPYHISIIRGQLTRNIGRLFSNLREEVSLAFEDAIPPTDEWTKVKALDTSMKIVSRSANRIFVGTPTCRDPEYVELNVRFTADAAIGGRILTLFPDLLKPIAARLLTNVPKSVEVGLKHLRHIIQERKDKIKEYGVDYPDKPVDVLSWLMDEAQGDESTIENLTHRVLVVNFTAIHTSSMTFANTLFELASRPEYIEPIRQEVEAILAEDGWTKVAMTRMRKLDSFLKEAQRINGIGALSMTRKVLKEFTFSNGTRLPKGAFVSGLATPRHLDNNVYPEASTFNGFRFSNMREEEGEETKNQMVATSLDYLSFGHGRHACPGRFFAASLLKAMIIHVVLTYDIMMTDKPHTTWVGINRIPDKNAEVLFRKRRV